MRRFQRVRISGAASGMGLALARGHRAEGATVYGSARNAEELGVIPLPLDVRDPNALAQAIERICAEGPLELTNLNARGSFPEAQETAETLFAHLELNALALLHPRMQEHRLRRIARRVSAAAQGLRLRHEQGLRRPLCPELQKEGIARRSTPVSWTPRWSSSPLHTQA